MNWPARSPDLNTCVWGFLIPLIVVNVDLCEYVTRECQSNTVIRSSLLLDVVWPWFVLR